MWHWYYKLLANRPHLVLLCVAVFSSTCIVISLTFKKLPEFTDPSLGFEARGTPINQKLTAWRNLLEETRPRGTLIANPYDNTQTPTANDKNKKGKGHRRKNRPQIHYKNKLKLIKATTKNKTANIDFNMFDDNVDRDSFNGSRHEHWDYGKNLTYTNVTKANKQKQATKDQWKILREFNPPSSTTDIHIPTDGFFCDSPNNEYAHFIVQRVNHNLTKSLFEINALLAMCDLEVKLTSVNYYSSLCQIESDSKKCCRPWSLPNYIALLANKTSCFDISEEDLLSVKSLLQECYEYYHSMKLSNDCINNKCRVPSECEQHNAVYNILHFLVDIEFIKMNDSNVYLTAGMIFLPIAKSSKALPYYHNIGGRLPSNELVTVVAMDMGIKNALFDYCIIYDGWLVVLGGLFVLICMWLYTNSIFITFMTIIANVFSLGISYFIYTFLFELPFFPFMNLLAVIVLIGIGADDAFIFVKIWNCSIAERVKSLGLPSTSTTRFPTNTSYPDTLAGLMASTLKHASSSMLVTSLTTAIAFYTSYLSSITAIRCFGIFAGTAVIANYLLMVTWLPASVSVKERISCSCQYLNYFTWPIQQFKTKLFFLGNFFQDLVISAVVKLPYLWIVILGAIGILSGFIIFYWPKFRLPDSPDFQLFSNDHPFEIYDTKFKNMFWFEKLYTDSETFKLPIRFVWGVQPVDDGNYLIPTSRGSMHLDNNFNISSIESQVWLLNFCREFKRQPFYQMSNGPPMLPNCFIENFIRTMERRCFDAMSGINRMPCCETLKFPYPPHIFDECLPQIISILYESPRYVFIPGIAGPKFARDFVDIEESDFTVTPTNSSEASIAPKKFPVVKALVVEYESTQSYTMSYASMENFTKTVENWFIEALASAPVGMQNAWFISDLEFYDLQRTLSDGTIYAICIAMIASLIVLMLVTLNIIISIFAVLTVTFSIFATVGFLVILGWKLNVLESISVSTAIGLAVDFTLHYGVSYRMSPISDRESATRFALSRMLGPTVMAAITTGAAGAFMLPSNVLAYIQIGKFLLIVMSISWIYSSLFFTSLLRIAGPQYGFGQITVPKLKKRENKNGKCHHNDFAAHGTVSEQLLSASSSAAGEFIGSESHELSSLNSNSILKPASILEARPISFDRAFKSRYMSYSKEHSPTSASAITEVLPADDVEYDKQKA